MEHAFLAKLEEEIENVERRVIELTSRVDRLKGDDLIEETAILRNVTMQLEGLKLMLHKIAEQEHGS